VTSVALSAASTTVSISLNSWISAAQGDPSGLWLLSLLSGLVLPQSFVWGEFASIGMADARTAERYFGSGAGGGSIIGNPATEFFWAGGGLVRSWPANPSENQYTTVANSNVPTLLIGGTLDFETPAQNATKELLPHLPHGHQVILPGLGHTVDFWHYEPNASTRLLTTFYATGGVDPSRYTRHAVSFATPGWSGAALIVLTLWPALSLTSEPLGIAASGGPIALGLYLAWVRRDLDRAAKSAGFLAAGAGALLGGWLGFTATAGLFALVTTTIGAAAAGNLALIAVSLFRARSARKRLAGQPPGGVTIPNSWIRR
jgi:hypothetical protein